MLKNNKKEVLNLILKVNFWFFVLLLGSIIFSFLILTDFWAILIGLSWLLIVVFYKLRPIVNLFFAFLFFGLAFCHFLLGLDFKMEQEMGLLFIFLLFFLIHCLIENFFPFYD